LLGDDEKTVREHYSRWVREIEATGRESLAKTLKGRQY
jgi:hypothetical protein